MIRQSLFTIFLVLTNVVWGQFQEKDLDVTKFRNGDPIMLVMSESDWQEAFDNGTPAYCYVNNDPEQGVLYNWAVVNDERGLAPYGWMIPSKDDFLQFQGKWMQSRTGGWETFPYNVSTFNANPKGIKSYDGGLFLSQGAMACYWTSTKSEKSRKSYSVQIWDGQKGFTYNADERRETFCSVRAIRNPNESFNPEGINGTKNVCEDVPTKLSIKGGGLSKTADWVWYSIIGSKKEEIGRGDQIVLNQETNIRVGLRYEDQNGKVGAFVYHDLTVHKAPNLPERIDGDNYVCEGNRRQFRAIGYKNYGTEWTWYVNGSNYGKGDTKEIDFSRMPSPTVITISADNEYCKSDETLSKTVNIWSGSKEPSEIKYYTNGGKYILSQEGGALGDGEESDKAKWVWYKSKKNYELKKIGEGEKVEVSNNKSATYFVRSEDNMCGGNGEGVRGYIKRKNVIKGWGNEYADTRGRLHWGMIFGGEFFMYEDTATRQSTLDNTDSSIVFNGHGYGFKFGFSFHPIMNEYFSFGIRADYSFAYGNINERNNPVELMDLYSSDRDYILKRPRLGGELAIGFVKDGKMKLLIDYDLLYQSNNFEFSNLYEEYSYSIQRSREERIAAGFRFGSYTGKVHKSKSSNFDILGTLTKYTNRTMFDFEKSDYSKLFNWRAGLELDLWVHNVIRLHGAITSPVSFQVFGSNQFKLKQCNLEFGLVLSPDKFR